MKNRLKNLFILLLFIAASFVGVKGAAAATGTATATTAMGSVSINLGGAASIAVNMSPLVYGHDETSQQVLNDAYLNAQSTWFGKSLDVFTVPCWTFRVSLATGKSLNSGGWVCSSPVDSGAASNDLSVIGSEQVTGTLGTANPLSCEPMSPTCGNPSFLPNLQPTASAIDAFVGQALTYEVESNWCSYIAPAGSDLTTVASAPSLGCAQDDPEITFGAALSVNGNRVLASASTCGTYVSGVGYACNVKVQVQASASDCHVPKVKGLTLAKAKLRLRQAHCGSTVRYVRGNVPGRVRYQPIKVGTGKPKNYRVTLSVVR